MKNFISAIKFLSSCSMSYYIAALTTTTLIMSSVVHHMGWSGYLQGVIVLLHFSVLISIQAIWISKGAKRNFGPLKFSDSQVEDVVERINSRKTDRL